MCNVCLCPYVCVYTIHVCEYMFFLGQSCLYQYRWRTDGAEFYQWRTCELVQAAVQKQNSRRQAKHRGLSQVYYICQQWSFITTGQRSHSFPLNAASSGTCKCVRQILSHQHTHGPPDYLKLYSLSASEGGSMWLHHISQAYRPLIHYRVSYHHHRHAESASLRPKRQEEKEVGVANN